MRRKRLSQEWVRSTTQGGSEAGLALDCRGFLAARADVGGEAELGGELVHLWVVVALIETQPLRPLRGRRGPLDRDRLESGATQLEVVQVRARRGDPDRDALALGEER